MEEKIETLAANIYARIVVAEFYQPDGLSYSDIEHKARHAAAFFYKHDDAKATSDCGE